MEQKLNEMIDSLMLLKKEAFSTLANEELYKSLNRGIHHLMEARNLVREK